MDKKSALEAINLFKKRLESKGINIIKLILYGSFAKGTFTEISDIDLVVVSDDFSSKDYWERINILSDAIYDVFAPVEAVAMTSEEWEKGKSFVSDYARNGEIVYSA